MKCIVRNMFLQYPQWWWDFLELDVDSWPLKVQLPGHLCGCFTRVNLLLANPSLSITSSLNLFLYSAPLLFAWASFHLSLFPQPPRWLLLQSLHRSELTQVLALTEVHLQQKNSGLCLCVTQFCLGTRRGCESHMMPPSCAVLGFDTISLGRRASQNQKWLPGMGSTFDRLWPCLWNVEERLGCFLKALTWCFYLFSKPTLGFRFVKGKLRTMQPWYKDDGQIFFMFHSLDLSTGTWHFHPWFTPCQNPVINLVTSWGGQVIWQTFQS